MEYTNLFPIILLAVFLQSDLFVCNSNEDIQILVANDIPVLFEDIPMLLLCHIPENSIHATFSWVKDNVEIAECSSDTEATREIQLPPNVTLDHFEDDNGAFCLLKFNNLSIVDHRGLYTCFSEVGNSSRQEEFNLDILERKPFCTAKKQGPQEYLAGDRATFMCHNPFYSPRREIQLSIGEFWLGGLINTTREFTFDLSGTTTLDGRHNGSMFNCEADQFKEDTANQTTNTTEYSCSLGPIYIYEFSFLLIEEFSEVKCHETMTIRCRVVPASEEAEIKWRIPEGVDDYTIEESGLYSMLKLPANSIDDEEEVVCYTSLANQNLSKSYQLRRVVPCMKPGELEPGGTPMLPFIISVAVVGGIAGTVVFIFILIVIYKCCCGKVGRQRHPQPPSTSNAKGDIISDNRESNMYPRYQPEPSALYLRPAGDGYDTPAGERYDIPPAGDVNHTPAEEFYDTSAGGEDDHTPAGEDYANLPGEDVDHTPADEDYDIPPGVDDYLHKPAEDYDTPPSGEDQHTPAGEEDYDTMDREDEAHDYDFPPMRMANLAMGLADYQV